MNSSKMVKFGTSAICSVVVASLSYAGDASLSEVGAISAKIFDATECLVQRRTPNGVVLANRCDKRIAVIVATCRSGGVGVNGKENAGHVCDDSASGHGWFAHSYHFIFERAANDSDGRPARDTSLIINDALSEQVLGISEENRWAACTPRTGGVIKLITETTFDAPKDDVCLSYIARVAEKVFQTGKSPRFLQREGIL